MTGGLRSRPTPFATLVALGFAMPAAAQPAAAQPLEPGAAYQASHDTATSVLTTHIRTLADGNDVPGLVALARDALVDTTLAPAPRERVLYETALALASLDLTADARVLLDELAAHEPAVQVWRYDDGHRMAGPLYDVASAARYAERRGDERRAAQSALAAIARSSDAPLAALDAAAAAGDDATRRGVLQAFATAPPEQLLIYRDRLSTTLDRSPERELAQIVARRLADAPLTQAVLERADAPHALEIVRNVRASFTPPDAFELLKAAAARDDVASAALLEMGPLVSEDPRARAFLFDLLDDDRRAGSAAAALAARHDPQIAAALRTWVQEQTSVVRARRGILALRLDASESARSELARLALDASLPAELRAEAQR